jgi:hypothetical protein
MQQQSDTLSAFIKPFSDNISALFKGKNSNLLVLLIVAVIALAIRYIVGRPFTYNDNPSPLQKDFW